MLYVTITVDILNTTTIIGILRIIIDILNITIEFSLK